jgi:hypothetical protein
MCSPTAMRKPLSLVALCLLVLAGCKEQPSGAVKPAGDATIGERKSKAHEFFEGMANELAKVKDAATLEAAKPKMRALLKDYGDFRARNLRQATGEDVAAALENLDDQAYQEAYRRFGDGLTRLSSFPEGQEFAAKEVYPALRAGRAAGQRPGRSE